MNLCIFRGNITKDGELKYLPSGTALIKFDLAVNYRFGKEDKTLFIKCSLFGKRAESLSQYLKKGTNLLVDGMLVENNWTGQDGRVNYSKELIVQNLEFAGCKSNNTQANQSRNNGGTAANTANQSSNSQANLDDIDEEALPF